MQESQSRLMAHQHLGLAEIQGLAGLGELFDTLVVFENYPVDARRALRQASGGLRLTGVAGHDATHYPLSLMAVPGERLRLRLDYRPDLFDAPASRRWRRGSFGCWRRRLRSPSAAIGSLDILAPTSATPSCTTGTTPRAPIPSATLPELFAAQVGRTPDAIAVVFEDEQLSYRELDARANQLAHHLRALGVGPETVVGLCVERSLEMLVGLLGILKAGGAYLPLDPDYPPERLAFMLADAGGAGAASPSGAARPAARPTAPASCCSMPTAAAIAAQPATRTRPAASIPHNAAYVIYTSGSTGTPKGRRRHA